MPDIKIVVEIDGDQKTAYEDTTGHERPGFIINDTEQRMVKKTRNNLGNYATANCIVPE